MPISRRAFAAGLTVAAAAGAGLDRLVSHAAARRAAHLAAEAKDRALADLAASDAGREAQTLRRLSESAEQDKVRALIEAEAQMPSAGDPGVSVGFERLARTRPWLRGLRSSIGLVECLVGGVTYRGAAELLDSEGGMVMCAHEFVDVPHELAVMRISFLPRPGRVIRLPLRIGHVDRDLDLAFARVDLRALPDVDRSALNPVRRMDKRAVVAPGETVTFVGFPEGVARLHATTGTLGGPRRVDTVNGDGSISEHHCKLEAQGVTFSGMSGGGMFRDGAFAGLVNFSSPAGAAPMTYVTPAAAITTAYGSLFGGPTKLAAPDDRTLGALPPKECKVDPAAFRTVSLR